MSFHHATLPNGLQVIAELDEQTHSVAAGFFVKAGSRDETPDVAGVSHFLEHMAFKGSERRDALAVNRDLDRIGAKHNAQTSEEDTVYHLACLPEYLPNSLDVLADILRPSLRDDDFETEKGVIIEEIRMYQDNPVMVAYEAAKELHFAPHPLGHSVLGTVDSIRDLKVERMRDYFSARYAPANIVLAVTGRTTWDTVLSLAMSRCGEWTGPAQVERTLSTPTAGGGFRALMREDDQQETVIGVATAPPLESDDRYAAALLATVLGDHTSSRLFWDLIDPGLADSVDLSYQDYNGAGAFYLFLSCDPDEAQANIDRVARTLITAMREGVTADELSRAQNKVLSRTVLRSERPMGRLMPLGFHWMYRHKYVSVADELEAIARVTPADLTRVMRRYPLLPLSIVTVGPTTELRPPAIG